MATALRQWGPSTLILLCLSVVSWAAAPVPLPAPEGLPKWEYCEIQCNTRRQQVVIHWVVGEEEMEAASWQELAEKMKIPAAKKDASEAMQRIRVLNRLGSDGWELVGVHKETTVSPDVWTFKRKVSK